MLGNIVSKFLKQKDQLISSYLREKKMISVLMLKTSLGSYGEDGNELTKGGSELCEHTQYSLRTEKNYG